LFNKNPYKNLIVNGLVLAADGKKMSKNAKNYPDPRIITKTHGADAVRLYLMNSQLVKGQSLRFKEEGLKDVVKDIFLPLYNSYKFLVQNIQRYEKANNTRFMFEEKYIKNNFEKLNLTDKWILAYSQRLIKFVRNEMDHYRLYTVVAELLNFLEKLTNWYIRLNRNRIKGDYGSEEALLSLNVLFMVTLDLIILLSPFIPFLTESIYQNLKNGIENPEASVHFLQIPKCNETFINEKIEKVIQDMICVIDQGRYLREQKKIVMKMPIAKIQVINSNQSFIDNIKLVENYVIEELNANEIEYILEESKYVKISANPNFQILYTKSKEIKDQMEEEDKLNDPELKAEEEKYKKEANLIASVIKKLDEKTLSTLLIDGAVDTGDKEVPKITLDQVLIKREFLKEYQKDKEFHVHANASNAIRISTEVNDKMMNAFYARDLTNKVQKMRKETGIKISDEISIAYSYVEPSTKLKAMLESSGYKESILKTLKVPFGILDKDSLVGFVNHSTLELDVAEEKIKVEIYKKLN
jgi:isoleucyl-tRNA synthetase